ncbi:acyltransferase family protein [Streptomyces sp. NPDC002659]|uniref:acyltransferase family protein n=1 Tax=Streptomyces sp. NPDC002659 TaxID=3364656 RepID=UPI0036BDBC56
MAPLWLVRLGEWSFAFFMIHNLVMRGAEELLGRHPELDTGPALALATTVLAVSLGLSWGLYRWVEQPGRQWILRGPRTPSCPATDGR